MSSYSDYYQAFPNPIEISSPIFDFVDKKLQYDVTHHLPDWQNTGDGLPVSHSCEPIAVNLSNGGDDALPYLYESTMESLGLQEIINPTMIANEQEAGTAINVPPLGIDYGEQPVYPVPKYTGREEIMGCNASYLLYHTAGNGSCMEVPLGKYNTTCGKMKNIQTDPYVNESVLESIVPVPLKKSKKNRCKSSSSKDREQKSNTELNVMRRDSPEMLFNIVTKQAMAECRKDYILVRVGRGQATDRHSLTERARRKKISERMNILQNLVPGCNKVTSKAVLLQEIINYVRSLQIEVKNLSMNLSAISSLPAFDDQITGHPFKELLPGEATTTDSMIASRISPHYVDHTHTGVQHPTPGTFVQLDEVITLGHGLL